MSYGDCRFGTERVIGKPGATPDRTRQGEPAMTSHSLLLSTCISCVIAFGGDGEGKKTLENAFRSIDTHSAVSLHNAKITVAPDSTQMKPGMASARKDSEALRRTASSEY